VTMGNGKETLKIVPSAPFNSQQEKGEGSKNKGGKAAARKTFKMWYVESLMKEGPGGRDKKKNTDTRTPRFKW